MGWPTRQKKLKWPLRRTLTLFELYYRRAGRLKFSQKKLLSTLGEISIRPNKGSLWTMLGTPSCRPVSLSSEVLYTTVRWEGIYLRVKWTEVEPRDRVHCSLKSLGFTTQIPTDIWLTPLRNFSGWKTTILGHASHAELVYIYS